MSNVTDGKWPASSTRPSVCFSINKSNRTEWAGIGTRRSANEPNAPHSKPKIKNIKKNSSRQSNPIQSDLICESPGGDALINCPADITLEPQKALKARRRRLRLPGTAKVKSLMLYVCSYSTNIFLIQHSWGACEEESEVHKHRHKNRRNLKEKKSPENKPFGNNNS